MTDFATNQAGAPPAARIEAASAETKLTVSRFAYRISPHHALTAAALCWLGFVLVVVLVQTGRVGGLDQAGLTFWRLAPDLRPRGPAWLLEAVRDYTALGGVLLRHLFALFALVALLFMHHRREAALLGLTIMGGWVVNSALKLLVGRERPTIVPHLTEACGASFPSGHAFNSACVYLAIALAFAALSPRRDVRRTIIITALVMTALIAVSRVWLGVHFPSDVIAGWLGGVAWTFTATALLHRTAKAVGHTLPKPETA